MATMMDRETLILAGASKVAGIISRVEARCGAADGPVTLTKSEMMADEFRELWLAAAEIRAAALLPAGPCTR